MDADETHVLESVFRRTTTARLGTESWKRCCWASRLTDCLAGCPAGCLVSDGKRLGKHDTPCGVGVAQSVMLRRLARGVRRGAAECGARAAMPATKVVRLSFNSGP